MPYPVLMFQDFRKQNTSSIKSFQHLPKPPWKTVSSLNRSLRNLRWGPSFPAWHRTWSTCRKLNQGSNKIPPAAKNETLPIFVNDMGNPRHLIFPKTQQKCQRDTRTHCPKTVSALTANALLQSLLVWCQISRGPALKLWGPNSVEGCGFIWIWVCRR